VLKNGVKRFARTGIPHHVSSISQTVSPHGCPSGSWSSLSYSLDCVLHYVQEHLFHLAAIHRYRIELGIEIPLPLNLFETRLASAEMLSSRSCMLHG
jgi:hypothetical protein